MFDDIIESIILAITIILGLILFLIVFVGPIFLHPLGFLFPLSVTVLSSVLFILHRINT